MAIPAIAAEKNVLICAPTGTGKTLCAFISLLSDLLQQNANARLAERVDTVYVSPLKALSTDITRNLTIPLNEIAANCEIQPASDESDAKSKNRIANSPLARPSASDSAPATPRPASVRSWSKSPRTFWSPRPRASHCAWPARESAST